MDVTTGAPPTQPLRGLLDMVQDGLAQALNSPVWSRTDAESADGLEQVHQIVAMAEALRLRLIHDADTRELASQAGATSTAAWLRHKLKLHPSAVGADVKLAKALETNLQATGQALAAGRISALHAKIIRESINLLPKDISDDQKREGEARLLQLATQHDPKELRQLGIHLYETIDPEDAERRLGEQLERERKRAEQKRSITFSHSGPGLQSARVQLPVDEMARLKALLDPLARPRKTDANGPDTRTASRRLGDAFVELLDLTLAAGEAPTRGGTKPQIIITMTLAQLVTGIGYATLDSGEQISAETARLLACDADVIPAVLDGKGQVLDLGRTTRFFTAAQRHALGIRDSMECNFPARDRPAKWCDAHHITHWADGGLTDLNNDVLLCGAHHNLIHNSDWQARTGPNGRPEYIPPPWIDINQHPIRT
ncbi:HNH endonuclease signature motif containing protein [Actinopolymorpha alba]|uniref:HNH endonuclease signature motif containing protein n=1 Tax=Actinopolymorpha alba TaxID=533267 RepID=UPI0009FBBDF3|nr:HNH endonuclease signature motif containing protein [Actinopolymorpha alba]